MLKQKHHHVHLSADQEIAKLVGQRYGKPVVLVVRSGKMYREGHLFYRSENGVWLTHRVPPLYIDWPEEHND